MDHSGDATKSFQTARNDRMLESNGNYKRQKRTLFGVIGLSLRSIHGGLRSTLFVLVAFDAMEEAIDIVEVGRDGFFGGFTVAVFSSLISFSSG